MERTLKIILILPKREDPLSWPKPVVLLKQKSPTEYELPLVIEDTQSYPFDSRDKGHVEPSEALMKEIRMAAAKEFGNEGEKAFEGRWGDIYQVHKTEQVAYFMFTRAFDWEWLNEARGLFASRGKPVCLEHHDVVDVFARYKQFLKSVARYSVAEKPGRNNLSRDDLEALCMACKHFAQTQKQRHDIWGIGAKKITTRLRARRPEKT